MNHPEPPTPRGPRRSGTLSEGTIAWLDTMGEHFRAAKAVRDVSPATEAASLLKGTASALAALGHHAGLSPMHRMGIAQRLDLLTGNIVLRPGMQARDLIAASRHLDAVVKAWADAPRRQGQDYVTPDASFSPKAMETTRFAAGLITTYVQRSFPATCQPRFQDAPAPKPEAPLAWYRALKESLDQADDLHAAAMTAEGRPAALAAYRKVHEAFGFFRARTAAELSEGKVSDRLSMARLRDYLARTDAPKAVERVTPAELESARTHATHIVQALHDHMPLLDRLALAEEEAQRATADRVEVERDEELAPQI